MLSQNKYKDVETKRELPFKNMFLLNKDDFHFATSVSDFYQFLAREQILCTVFFGISGQDNFELIVENIILLTTNNKKCLIVDLKLLPSLALDYNIRHQTLLKMLHFQVISIFDQDFTVPNINAFIHPKNHGR